MFQYSLHGDELYRFDQQQQVAEYWNEWVKTWESCPEKYNDLTLGFYYEEDDPHWIQTFRVISEARAEEIIKGKPSGNSSD